MLNPPTVDDRLDTITQALRSSLAICQVLIDRDSGYSLTGMDLNTRDLAEPARADITAALEDLYWLSKLPDLVRQLPAPDDDQAAAMGQPRSWEQEAESETAGAR